MPSVRWWFAFVLTVSHISKAHVSSFFLLQKNYLIFCPCGFPECLLPLEPSSGRSVAHFLHWAFCGWVDTAPLTILFLSLCSQAPAFAASDLVFCCVVVSLPPLFWASSRAALAWYVRFFLFSQSPGEMELMWLFTCWVKSLPSHTRHFLLLYL